MSSKKGPRQASKQVPWRLQIRSTGKTALWLVGLLVLGGVYLAVNAKLARAGRELLVLERRREELQRLNSELSAAWAQGSSPDLMLERAAYLGFRPAHADEVMFIEIEGYSRDAPFDPPRPPSSGLGGESMLSPAYTETLGEWLARWLNGGG